MREIRRTLSAGCELDQAGAERPETFDMRVVRVLATTRRAYRILGEDGRGCWIPKSVLVDHDPRTCLQDDSWITVKLWWAKAAKFTK